MYGQAQRYLRLAAVFVFDKHSLVVLDEGIDYLHPLDADGNRRFFQRHGLFYRREFGQKLDIIQIFSALEPLNDA